MRRRNGLGGPSTLVIAGSDPPIKSVDAHDEEGMAGLVEAAEPDSLGRAP